MPVTKLFCKRKYQFLLIVLLKNTFHSLWINVLNFIPNQVSETFVENLGRFSSLILLSSSNWDTNIINIRFFIIKIFINQIRTDSNGKLKSWTQKRRKIKFEDQIQKLKAWVDKRDLLVRMLKSLLEFSSSLPSCQKQTQDQINNKDHRQDM